MTQDKTLSIFGHGTLLSYDEEWVKVVDDKVGQRKPPKNEEKRKKKRLPGEIGKVFFFFFFSFFGRVWLGCSIIGKQKEFYNLLLFSPTDYTTTKSDLVKEKTKESQTNYLYLLKPFFCIFLLRTQRSVFLYIFFCRGEESDLFYIKTFIEIKICTFLYT